MYSGAPGRAGPGPPAVAPLRTVPSRPLGSDRPDEREAAPRRAPRRTSRIDLDIVGENGGDHLVLHHLGRDVPIEGRRGPLAPALGHDVEGKRVAAAGDG